VIHLKPAPPQSRWLGSALKEVIVMRTLLNLLTAGVMAALTMTASPAQVDASSAVAMVSGGGTGDFVATPNSVNTSGFTDFGIGVTVYADGTAQGHFVCTVPAVVTISGDVLGGSVNTDGSVTVWGRAHGYDHFFKTTFTDMPFTARFREGKAEVGGFDYRDESGFFPLPTQFDTEVVRRGQIRILP
jgi:hypothetical protein